MPIRFFRRRLLLVAAAAVVLAGGATWAVLRWRLREALRADAGDRAPLAFTALPVQPLSAERWGSGDVEAVAASPESLLSAGGSGIRDERGELGSPLPTLRATALALWRGRPVAGLGAGGLFLFREGRWEEARTGYGLLHVRTLLETAGGELLIGAQEGLFRAAWGDPFLVRLDRAPVRSLAASPEGLLLAGGEQGLRRIEGNRARLLPTPDPWVDWVGLRGQEVAVVTPMGLAAGPLEGTLLALPGGQDATGAAVQEGRLYAVADNRLLRFEASGRAAEEFLPAPPRRVFTSAGLLLVDTSQGLFRRTREGWTLARPRPAALPPGPAHVTAIATQEGRLVLGCFDGGLVQGRAQGDGLAFEAVPGAAVWGVNALLPAGGALYVASLRGSARFDGKRLEALDPPGGSYALATAREGVARGLGTGVLLGDGRFLSAFHGLPGNQALALAVSGDDLFVGTPTGLGAVRGAKVLWRAVSGDGRLPHPWVTALAPHRGALYVGTYGGGVTRRAPGPDGAPGTFTPFAETGGFKVNPGCLAVAGGRLFLGTDGKGLLVLAADGSRFVRVGLAAPRITALHGEGPWLYVGTDEGLLRLSLGTLKEGA